MVTPHFAADSGAKVAGGLLLYYLVYFTAGSLS
jgi:hypothetical protein